MLKLTKTLKSSWWEPVGAQEETGGKSGGRLGRMKAAAAWALLAVAALSWGAERAAGATFYWDPDGNAGNGYGGDGAWDTTSAFWNTTNDGTGSLVTWPGGTETANFGTGGVGGTVTVDAGGISALNLDFNSGSAYIFEGGPLTLTRTSGVAINLAGGNTTATFNNSVVLSGAVNLRTNSAGQNLNLAGGIVKTSSGLLTISSFSSSTVTSMGAITGTASNLTIGTATGGNGSTYVLNGNNTALTGNKTFIRGNLILNHNGALGGGSLNVGHSAPSASNQFVLIGTDGVTINGNLNILATDTTANRVIGSNISSGTAIFSGNLNLAGTGASVRSDTGGTTVFSGTIGDGGNGLGVTKIGNGVVKFTQSTGNTYSGGTIVSEGTLLVNNASGSGTGSGAVTVASGATLGGLGSVSGGISLAAGAVMAPGDGGAGTFGGSSLTWDSDDSTAGMLFELGASSDLLTLSGAFTKGTGTSFIFDFADAGGLSTTTYTLATFASTDFNLGDFAFTTSLAGMSGAFGLTATDLTFTVTQIPEPSAATFLAICAGLSTLRTARRLRRSLSVRNSA